MAKTTEQLEHALCAMDVKGVELRAVEVVGEGSEGSIALDREVQRVRTEVRVKSLSTQSSVTCSAFFSCPCGFWLGALALKFPWLVVVHDSVGMFVLP